MSWGGSVLAMITSLKNNARPKRKHFDREKSLHFKAVNPETLVSNKTATPEMLNKIQVKVQQENRNYWIKNILYIVLIIITLVIISHFFIDFFL